MTNRLKNWSSFCLGIDIGIFCYTVFQRLWIIQETGNSIPLDHSVREYFPFIPTLVKTFLWHFVLGVWKSTRKPDSTSSPPPKKNYAVIIQGVMNGPLKFLTTRKILPLLDLLAKFKRVLACSCFQNFCSCAQACFLVGISRNFVNPSLD